MRSLRSVNATTRSRPRRERPSSRSRASALEWSGSAMVRANVSANTSPTPTSTATPPTLRTPEDSRANQPKQRVAVPRLEAASREHKHRGPLARSPVLRVGCPVITAVIDRQPPTLPIIAGAQRLAPSHHHQASRRQGRAVGPLTNYGIGADVMRRGDRKNRPAPPRPTRSSTSHSG